MGISGNSKEVCASPPVDPVDCVPMDPPVVAADGGAEPINSVKVDSAAPVSPPVPEGRISPFYFFVGLELLGEVNFEEFEC